MKYSAKKANTEVIAVSLRDGNSFRKTCAAGDISHTTFYKWFNKGTALMEEKSAEDEPTYTDEDMFYINFYKSIQNALGEYIRGLLSTIEELASGCVDTGATVQR